MKNTITYSEAIATSMENALKDNSNTILYGLGVTDHIGIFGTTRGLESKYGKQRVFDTPISEDAMTGFAMGASLGGVYPIHIHIRADFLFLAMNQLINSIAKYKYMYGGLFSAPMLIRAIIGRSWGQGPQHSQSLQTVLSHTPGLTVIMPSSAESIEKSYSHAINKYRNPVISLEHRLLYDYNFNIDTNKISDSDPFSSYVVKSGNDVTIIASSIMVQEAIKASKYINQWEDVSIEIIDAQCISNLNKKLILKSLEKTKKLIVADTSWLPFGLGAEISRMILEESPNLLEKPMINLGMAHCPCPTSKTLEYEFYPDLIDMVRSVYELVFDNYKNKRIPSTKESIESYKYFKGPF